MTRIAVSVFCPTVQGPVPCFAAENVMCISLRSEDPKFLEVNHCKEKFSVAVTA